jgi:tRNA nucleotidyltransferase (CCA-adding enzyme)
MTETTKKSKARTYQGSSYQALQKKNGQNRVLLTKEQKAWLKKNNYRNVGWDKVIQLYEKIAIFLEVEDSSLEELFLEADRIGNKYQSDEEIESFQQAMAETAEKISELIDQQFPPVDQIEMIDFSDRSEQVRNKSSRNMKTYRTLVP